MVMYINHIEGTKKALRDNGIMVDHVKIYSKRPDILGFIAQVTRPSNKEEAYESLVEL